MIITIVYHPSANNIFFLLILISPEIELYNIERKKKHKKDNDEEI